jgi:hypothetical protein
LANRAVNSRTSLYQIESGKTGLPRAGTLRRIAVALDVPMEDLLGMEDQPEPATMAPERPGVQRRSRGLHDWAPSEGGPLTMPGGVSSFKTMAVGASDESRFTIDQPLATKPNGYEPIFVRERELMSKLHDLLHSPIGDGVASIVEVLHTMLPRTRNVH